MEPTSEEGGGGSSGGGGGGISRFRSTPATWLEALLKEEDEEEDPLGPTQCFTQLLSSGTENSPRNLAPFDSPAVNSGGYDIGSSSNTGFSSQNSSPANLFGHSMVSSSESGFGIQYSHDVRSQDIDMSSMTDFKSIRQNVEHVGKAPDLDIEKILEDSVPCRVRAKRGHATHPRSIAERVRRTRISDRIRKLQELVPNMDKMILQTNTAEMLDEAVAYVKSLQKQIEELTEHQRKCKCAVQD